MSARKKNNVSQRQNVLVRLLLPLTILITHQVSQAATPGVTPGEFSVDASGSANYTVPIAVPPGTAGMQPSLTLSYNSRSGNGLLGVGWTLGGLSVITRCPTTKVVDGFIDGIDFDENDRFCIDGQRLIQVTGNTGDYGKNNIEYRTEVDGFTKVISYDTDTTNNGPEYFIAYTKSGQILEYGNDDNGTSYHSRIEAQGKTDVRLWAVNKISDTVGNYLTVTYSEDATNGSYQPTQIDYTANDTSTPALVSNTQVTFEYETRTDTTTLYFAGSKVKNTERLTNIKTYSNSTLVRDYQLSYDNDGAANRSRLNSITECDGNVSCFYPVSFQLEGGGDGLFEPSPKYTDITGVGWTSAYGRYFQDINGDGLVDFILSNNGAGHVYVHLGKGDGLFEPSPKYTDITGVGWTSAYGRYFQDINGDGLVDFILSNNGAGHVYVHLGKGDGLFEPSPKYTDITGVGWTSAYGRYFQDINGDGLVDFILSNNGAGHVYVHLGKGDGLFEPSPKYTDITGVGWTSAYGRYFQDINGDGLVDFILSNNLAGHVYVHLGKGDGLFEPSPKYTDITGVGWTSAYGRYFQDINGDGLVDFILSNNLAGHVYVHLGKGDGLFLVKNITDSLGNETTIVNKPITDSSVYTKGSSAVYPEVDVQGPVYVVSKVTVDDGVGSTRDTDYSYTGAKSSLDGRGFLGFRSMTAVDSSTGIKTKTTYSQTHPYIGLVERTEQRLSNDDLIGEVDTTFAHHQTHTGVEVDTTQTPPHPGVLFPYASTVTKKDYEID